MMLYVAIVLMATLTALPSDPEEGPHGVALIGLIWGETIGLALAHWFAFRLTARGFSGGGITKEDAAIAAAQIAGAAATAALCSIPVILFDDDADVQFTILVPALIVGGAGYLASREAGRSSGRSLVLGAVVMALGFGLAIVKSWLAGH